jgi:hypothetical protein
VESNKEKFRNKSGGHWPGKDITTMRYKVELLSLSATGETKELFHLVVYAPDENDAIIKAQKEYALRHPDAPLPPENSSWISYSTREEDCWG